jgi:hypothetical protein
VQRLWGGAVLLCGTPVTALEAAQGSLQGYCSSSTSREGRKVSNNKSRDQQEGLERSAAGAVKGH